MGRDRPTRPGLSAEEVSDAPVDEGTLGSSSSDTETPEFKAGRGSGSGRGG